MNKRQRKKALKKFLVGRDPKRTYVKLVSNRFNRHPMVATGLEVGRVYTVGNRLDDFGKRVTHSKFSDDSGFLWVMTDREEREQKESESRGYVFSSLLGHPKLEEDLIIIHKGEDYWNSKKFFASREFLIDQGLLNPEGN